MSAILTYAILIDTEIKRALIKKCKLVMGVKKGRKTRPTCARARTHACVRASCVCACVSVRIYTETNCRTL